MTKQYTCSGCGLPKPRGDFHEKHPTDRKREVTSQCRECRSEVYFSKRYETVCDQCMHHRPLNSNHCCKRCNEETGLRQCIGPCGEILPTLLEFDGKHATCKRCRKLKQPVLQQPGHSALG